ncbi:MAG: hypothetical protein IPN92_07725 [Chromatiaceae bacterium]|nr:hypothetical protein [Chromatiaceae bacterium]
MNLDHTPSPIVVADFGTWLDYCILGAGEMGRRLPERRGVEDRTYDRPLTPQQQRTREECRTAAARQGARA